MLSYIISALTIHPCGGEALRRLARGVLPALLQRDGLVRVAVPYQAACEVPDDELPHRTQRPFCVQRRR